MIESQTISTLASRLEIAALAHPESFEVQQLRERVKRADALVASLSAAGLVTICHTSICARTREDISALVLYGLKLCQLKDKMFCERVVKEEMLCDPDPDIGQLRDPGHTCQRAREADYEFA